MTTAGNRNRLAREESPYLRQHADNPVNWQPWDEQALAEAEERDVPMFLSIGYSACHWCHVMEDESFESDSTATILNENFVPIKVDREERPDLDSIYQTICQLVTGSGGWPLSVWLTPDGEPFYVGTYFPPEPRGQLPAFETLLRNIAESWTDPDDRAEMERRATQWQQAIEGEIEDVPEQPGELSESVLDTLAQAALRSADREYGGFGSGQKFPQTGRIRALMRAFERTGQSEYRQLTEMTLDAMVSGGLYDHIGGGFHRYTTDRQWVVPHFEKMLYDNAEISRVLLAGYQLTGHERYREAARETFEFVGRELTHPKGGFYATLDAQSDGEEGTFYVWNRKEIHDALTAETADLFCDRYGVTESGNFENGTTVLTVSQRLEDLAEEYDCSVESVETTLADARKQLFEIREGRTRPGRDEKVIAGWNGLMIGAFAEGSLVADGDECEQLVERARDALSFVQETLWTEDEGRLARRYKETDGAEGSVKGDGYLEDYAFLGRGALSLFEATGEIGHLGFALNLARAIEREFWDASESTLYFTPESGEQLIVRPQELSDQSTPSSAGVATALFLALDGFVPHDRFKEIADGVLSTHAASIEADPLRHTSLALAGDTAAVGHTELTITASELPDDWRERIGSTYLPRRLIAQRPPTKEALDEWLDTLSISESPPLWKGRDAIDEEPTVYLCESFSCSPPKTDIEEALNWRTTAE